MATRKNGAPRCLVGDDGLEAMAAMAEAFAAFQKDAAPA